MNVPKCPFALDLPCLIMLIPNKDVFTIVNLSINARRIIPCRNINLALWEGERHSARGVDVSVEDVGDGIAYFIT